MRIDVPESKKLVYEMTMPIQWGDMDAMGHVNNVQYFRYMETLRLEWMRSVGFVPDPTGEGPVIVNTFCNYHVQLEYPGEIVARLYVANPGRSSFDKFVTLSRTDRPDVVYASGGATTVWVDLPKQKSVPLPQRLRELIGG